MKALHTIAEMPSKIAESVDEMISQELTQPIAELENYIQQIYHSSEFQSFSIHEQHVGQLIRHLGQTALKLILSIYDMDVPRISDGEKDYRKVLKSTREYQTSFGPIPIARHLYKPCGRDGHSICPLELQSGILKNYWTPGAAKQAMWLLAHMTPQEAEESLTYLYGMTPSKSSLDRLPKALGAHWEPDTLNFHAALLDAEKISTKATLCVTSLDGVMVAMKGDKTLEKSNERATYHWREGSCGTVSYFDEAGERLSTIYYGCMPEHKKSTLKKLLLLQVEAIRKKRPDLTHLYLADGAQDNWTFFDEEMPLANQLTDFFHACEYLQKAFESAYSTDKAKAKEKFEQYKTILRDEKEGVDRILRCLRYLRSKDRASEPIQKACTYFQNNQHRMNYAEAKEKHHPIGSGIVEAGCKSLVQHRLKRSGMSWRHWGGQTILTFRALAKSYRFDGAWDLIAKTYEKVFYPINNVLAFSGQKLG